MADRIAEPEVAAEPVRSGLVEGVRDERHICLEAAEGILSSAKRRGPSTVIVGPCKRQETGEDAVASGRFARGIIQPQHPLAPTLKGTLLAVVERVPIVGSLSRVENQPTRLAIGDELHPLALRLSGGASVNLRSVADLERHPTVAQPIDRHDRTPAVAFAVALDLGQPVIDQRCAVQPLAEQPFQIDVRHFFGDAAKRLFVDVLEAPARVIGAQNLPHDVIAHDVAQLFVEELSLRVDHRVVGQKVTVAFADHGDRLAPAIQVPEQNFAFDIGVAGALPVRLEEPARLKTREALVQEALAPLVVGEHAHRVIVAELVDDQAEAGPAVHDHHGEFCAAALDAMHVRDLRPAELAVQRVEPRERRLRSMDRYPVAPRRTVAGLVKDVNDDVLVAALLVAIGGVQRESEVVHGISVEPNAFAPGSHRAAAALTARPPVPLPLIVDWIASRRRGRCLLPTRITLNRDTRGTNHLVCSQVEHHVVAPEFAVELAGWIERMIFPAMAIVDDDLRIPLREVEAPALPPLTPR